MNEIILKEQNGQVVVSSREVAEKFGKRHDHVIRTIADKIEVNPKLGSPKYFTESTYLDKSNRQSKEYLMTRDGFSFLVMGFNGKDADIWKIKYIDAFNQMEEKLKQSNVLTEEERLKLQLFSKDASEVAYAHNRLVELQTAPLVAKIEEQTPKVEYHDNVLNKENLLSTTIVAKDLGMTAIKLHQILNRNKIIYKSKQGVWIPYKDYEWLVSEKYADYKSYTTANSLPCLKWTEKGRKWIIENIKEWK